MKKTMTTLLALMMFISLSLPLMAKSNKLVVKTNFRMPEGIFKDVYGSFNLELSGMFVLQFYKMLELTIEGSYYRDNGVMTISQEQVTWTDKSISYGMRARIIKLKDKFHLYAGAGARSFWIDEKVPARFEPFSDSGTGFYIEAGTYWYLGKLLIVVVNAKHVWEEIEVISEVTPFGGFCLGIGIGIQF